jgi:hypothetical protein
MPAVRGSYARFGLPPSTDIAVRFGATRRELDLQTVPALVPDNAVDRNSSEVIARF